MVAVSTSGGTIPCDVTEPAEQRECRPSDPVVESTRYALGGEIGRGGMGEVVSAHDVQIGREVAIKRMHATEPTPAARARFLREARIQGRLEHPSIPPVYELAHDEHGAPYFAMRKLDGVTLSATLRDPNSPFTRQRLLRAFIDVCNAVDLAHSRHIIHRDLKPANILLGNRGEVYVLDWGIARELDAPDAFVGPVQGTPGYMAPEQIRGDLDLDERVDVYALGCILFEILTRRPLHPRGAEAVTSALRGDFPAIDAPPELATACRRATNVSREQRLASVRELMEIVQGYLDGDRDLEQRRTLAKQHLARATDALVALADEESRRGTAMREAGQALALDPTLSGAAELIGRMMLVPPTTTPPSVERELEQLDWRAARTVGLLSLVASLVYLAILPVLIGLGFHDVPYLTAYGVLAVLMCAFTAAQIRAPSARGMIGFLISLLFMFALVARMFSPILIAPGLAATYLATIPFNPIVRRGRVLLLVTIGTLVAIFGVWAAELAGWLSSTMSYVGGHLILISPVDGAADIPALPLIGTCSALMISIGGAFSYLAIRHMRETRAQLVVQAWHLRQLAPTEQRAHDA